VQFGYPGLQQGASNFWIVSSQLNNPQLLQFSLRVNYLSDAEVRASTDLPFDFDGTPQEALAEYGQPVLARINFGRGRIYPSFHASVSVMCGAKVLNEKSVCARTHRMSSNATHSDLDSRARSWVSLSSNGARRPS
jgi:hypothetical protein